MEKEKVIDLSKILEGYDNKWIVLKLDYSKVIASGNSIENISDDLSKGIVMLVPDSRTSLILLVDNLIENATKSHHIFCNYWMLPRENCKFCDKYFEKYPYKEGENETEAVERIMKENFPNVITREGT